MNKSYRELEAWKCSKDLVKGIYQVTNHFPIKEQNCLTLQIRRAAISIPSNIAEGIGRNSIKYVIQFLYISRGSLYELETQIIIANELNYISNDKLNELLLMVDRVRRLLSGLINYYESKIKAISK